MAYTGNLIEGVSGKPTKKFRRFQMFKTTSALTAVAVTMLMGLTSVQAEEMKKDTMMKKTTMGTEMKKDAMMKKDTMKKDTMMKKATMGDDMKKDTMMKKRIK
jgi:hypothetical protein